VSPLPCGERLVRCLTGGDSDRVPFGVGLGWWPWGEAHANWKRASGQPDLDFARELGYDAGFVLPAAELGIFPGFEYRVLEETAERVVFRDHRGITMRNRKDGGSMPEFLDYPVKTPADWERVKAERLRIDDPSRLREDWDAFRARLKQTGESVQVGTYPYGMFGTPRDLLGAEELLVSFYTEPEMVKDMIQHLTSLWLRVYEQVAAEVQIDHIHIWEDMSGCQGSLISPAMAEAFMMPAYDRIADFAAAHGVRIISVDTDGDCAELVPLMMRHGVNLFLPFEVQAGNDVRAYRRQYPELGIMGGLDKRCLARTHADVDREVQRAADMLVGGRYVPMFDHLIPPDATWDNMRYAAVRIKELCYNTAANKEGMTCR
jgi:uroporphyrinogen decarboxylase